MSPTKFRSSGGCGDESQQAQWSISRATMLANSAGGLPGSQRRGAVKGPRGLRIPSLLFPQVLKRLVNIYRFFDARCGAADLADAKALLEVVQTR